MMRKVGTALGPTVNLGWLAAGRLRYGGYRQREKINAAVLALARDAVPIKEIVRHLDHSLRLIRQLIQGERQHISRAPSELTGPAVASMELEGSAVVETSAQRACGVFANASNRSKSPLEALAEARTIVPVLSSEPTIRRA